MLRGMTFLVCIGCDHTDVEEFYLSMNMTSQLSVISTGKCPT